MTPLRFRPVLLGAVFVASSGAIAGPSLARDGRIELAQAAPGVMAQAQPRRASGGIGDFGSQNNNKPINVEADKLEVFQKEGRAIYSGSVVAVQGDTTMKCTQLVVFFDQSRTGTPGAPAAANAPASGAQSGSQGDALKKLDCKGPVTVVAKSEGKTQIATGDNATYDRIAGMVTMTGNVVLADGSNVTKCSSFTYNTNISQMLCSSGGGGRVQGVFEPGGADSAPKPAPGAKPKT